MKKKILVTGGAGFIGSHTVVELIENGFEPIIVDNFSNSSREMLTQLEEITGQKVKCYELDCTSYHALFEVFLKERNLAGIIHFAAYKSVAESQENPIKYYQNNLGSLMNLLQLMERFKVTNLVFSSSATVYGEAQQFPIPENEPFKKAESAYGESKQMCEQLIRDAVKSSRHLKASMLRYFNPIGAHSSGLIGENPKGRPENLVPYMMQTLAGTREKLTVYGNDYDTPDGTCIRDYIHVVDLAKAHIKALEWLAESEEIGICEAFNIGTGRGHSVMEMIQMVEEVSQLNLNYSVGPRRAGDIIKSCADCSKAAYLLGWKAEYSMQKAIEDVLRWEGIPAQISMAS